VFKGLMRCLEIVYRSVTVLMNLKYFLKERFVEIKSRWYSSVKQLVNELPQSDRTNLYCTSKQTNKQTKCTLFAFFPKPVLTQAFKSVTPLDAMSPSN